MKKTLSHYGTPRRSGRYPWGSGEDPQRHRSFLQEVGDLEKKGLRGKALADGLGITTTKLRAKKSIAKAELRKAEAAEALRYKDKGMSNVAIGKRMGLNESSVRSLLDPVLQERSDLTRVTANMLKEAVEEKKYIDVGVGTELYLGVRRTKLKTALAILEEEGYKVHKFDIEQLGTGKKTNMMVLSKDEDGVYSYILKNKDQIKMIGSYSEDGGRSYLGLEPVRSVDSKRVQIRYHEDGGSDKDGVIELRRGVDDISLGNSKYAQVRIAVDGTHYLKGMAMYTDDLPKGIDIMFNTNKTKDVPKESVMKDMKKNKEGEINPDNPFGATVRQQHFITEKGKKTTGASEMLDLKRKGLNYKDIANKMKISEDLVKECVSVKALNIVSEEGEWHDKWSKSLSSQMLSKQLPSLAKKQLGLAFDTKKEEFDEIMSLTNPAVKKRLLDSFADDCDSSSVHLKSAAMPRTSWHVILPVTTMKENEVYAPNYKNGETVVLIRYPHGGTFEIPELTVNNKNKIANETLHNAKDAVGIHPKVAERLSGADFDGDTVLVIPNNSRLIKTSSPLKGLVNFDPKERYKPYDGMVTIDGGVYNAKTGKADFGDKKPKTATKQMKMGDVSNLITDMTIRFANTDEVARAVRHSMVVIDSEKHSLNYKQSYIDNGIASLKQKYQGKANGGASTLISRAKSEKRVDARKERIDPLTGKKFYEYTGETYTNRGGKIIKKTLKSTKMAETDDAFKLSSGTPMETVYAAHANKLKDLANTARKESIGTSYTRYSPSAKAIYDPQVASLKASLNLALRNKPLERQAQLLANTVVATTKRDNPYMDAAEVKRLKGQALEEARLRTHAKKRQIEITDKEWEAIQAGAITTNTLTQILNNTNLDRVKQLATPRTATTMTTAKTARAKSLLAKGYTQSEVADTLGVSVSTLLKVIG